MKEVTAWQLQKAMKEAGLSRHKLAVKLEKVIGSTADAWLRTQNMYDLARVRSRAVGRKIQTVRAGVKM